MSNNLKKYSFCDLLKQGKIRIPKIQRDYAQGRRSQKVDEIRKVFVHTLMLVVKGNRPASELDFVYGSNQNNAFEPLDGQQRLTTLFLLHWMMGVDLSIPNDKKHSLFTYETRNTSNEFCDELVQHNAIQFVTEANKKGILPSEVIRGRDWFEWEWKYDPTILSMLVMIDAISEEMGEGWKKDLSEYQSNLDHITFNLLNLGDFGLSNELFIKMNARGKQLSDFDKLKSTLEEELQLQQKETDENGVVLASELDEELWRSLMDGAWIDFFWHKYARQVIVETENIDPEDRKMERLRVARLSELQFKKLLLRLVAIQLFEKNPANEKLREASYYNDEFQIDNLLFVYSDSLTGIRSDENHVIVPSSVVTLSFKRLMEDMNLLLFKDSNDTFYEISYLLPEISHIKKNEESILDSFLKNRVSNDVELVFYAMLLFLREFPEKKEKKQYEQVAWYFDKDNHKVWLKNLEDWIRATRNILLNDNNNQRIDKIQYSMEATQSLKEMCADMVAFVRDNSLDIETDGTVVKQFLKSSDKTYLRLDNQSLAEEREKAKLILENSKWESCFDKAEQHKYLWGQIRCLLNWSEKQLDKFVDYSNRLQQLLDVIETDNLTYYTAILAFAPTCWWESNRLFQYNMDRDYSFKRYLREHTKEEQAFGAHIKELIDCWVQSYKDLSIQDYLNAIIESKMNGSETWIQCVIKDPSILNEAGNKCIFEQKGHVVLAQRKTTDSHCFDPVLLYYRNLCNSNQYEVQYYKFYDSKGDYEHAFQFERNSIKYFVEWYGTEGCYSIRKNDETPIVLSSSELKEYMAKIFPMKDKQSL